MSDRLNILMAVMLVLCALFLVNGQYQARRLFIELERTQAATRELEVAWAQLQVDQSQLAQHARVEAKVREKLNMVSVTSDLTQYVRWEER